MNISNRDARRKFRAVLQHHDKFLQRLERLRRRAVPWQIRRIADRHGVSLSIANVIAAELGLLEAEYVR
ncbi:MAG: hypothetical protein IT566_16530 [Rhodospirillaceae bacterium]|nr:hypothetical protein [Rhodospirillaceae bacterium]